ncbi:uncharacterized protein [Rutidosis leptorrhynchoides]|uniref:uncharacterized protein isoform X2 n=1 Tax=Rutidosis leptorrhynchoides TaxID=125765 RepID=UPI003A99234D
MEWTTVQHLDLRHVGRSSKPFQPHAATFHPTQALVAVAAGTYIIEFDAYTGSKISSINIGAPVVRMSYSPTSGHAVVAILEVRKKSSAVHLFILEILLGVIHDIFQKTLHSSRRVHQDYY